MLWVYMLLIVAVVLVLLGFWLTVSRIRNFRQIIEANRRKAFAEMEEIAKETGDPSTGSGQAVEEP